MTTKFRCREPLPSLDGPFACEEFERIERQYPNASAAEKYRLMQAQRAIDWFARQQDKQKQHAKC